MKPARFAYHAPGTVGDAVAVLAEAGSEGRVLAGGQSLVPMMNFRIASPAVLVDLANIADLATIEVDAAGTLVVGAGITMSRACDSPASGGWPLLREALSNVGHPQIRNRATLCGSAAHHDPAAELPAVAVALDAELTVTSSTGHRLVPAADFFVSYYETTLEPGELVTSIRFPRRPAEGWGFGEFARRRGDFALAGAAATLSTHAGRVSSTRLVLFGIDGRPRRLTEVETALVGQADVAGDALDDALSLVPGLIDPLDDAHASAELRRELAVETSRVALSQAWERRNV